MTHTESNPDRSAVPAIWAIRSNRSASATPG